jgi:hypothetical protein
MEVCAPQRGNVVCTTVLPVFVRPNNQASYALPMIHVLSVRYVGGSRLALEFDDDTRGEADLTPLIERGGLFAPLADPSLLARAFVDDGTVCWPDELDVPPERLYALTHGLPSPDTLEQANANELVMREREHGKS